jgi:2-dehydro-3-deoxygluconokinase
VRFVAVGDVLVDVISGEAPRAEERVHAPVTIRAGGSATNAAVWAAALGASAAVVGRVGADPAGDLVERVLVDRGIEARIARDPELPTGVAVALRTSIVASPGASARLASEDIPDPLTGDALLVSGFSLFQRDSAAGARAALDRFEGRSVAVDLASPRLAVNLDRTLARANAVFATADEARAVTGLDPEDAARDLAARFEVACVKLGEQGAIAVRGDEFLRANADPVTRQSPFGAGDAFAAAFLIGLASDEPLDDVLQSACEAGARAAASEDGWPA